MHEYSDAKLGSFIVTGGNVLDHLDRLSRESSANFIIQHLDKAELHLDRDSLYKKVIVELGNLPTGLFLEFGVWQGGTINIWADNLGPNCINNKVYGFDSFEGLRNTWSYPGIGKGSFNLNGVVPENLENPKIEIIQGWVEETLPEFLSLNSDSISFVHFDLDVYEPTKFALENMKSKLNHMALILFDEMIGFPGWEHGEFKALNEVFNQEEYEWVGFSNRQALIRIVKSAN